MAVNRGVSDADSPRSFAQRDPVDTFLGHQLDRGREQPRAKIEGAALARFAAAGGAAAVGALVSSVERFFWVIRGLSGLVTTGYTPAATALVARNLAPPFGPWSGKPLPSTATRERACSWSAAQADLVRACRTNAPYRDRQGAVQVARADCTAP